MPTKMSLGLLLASFTLLSCDIQLPQISNTSSSSANAPSSSMALTLSSASDSNSSSEKVENTGDNCTDPSLYFCDDFENGTLDNWDNLISSYDLPQPGIFDVLDDGTGKYMRFTAGTRSANLSEGELITLKPSVLDKLPGSDYFFEYKIRPRANSNTGSKHLFGMARYQGPLQWYLSGYNMQSSPSSTEVTIGYASTIDKGLSGTITKASKVKKPIVLGTKDATDGVWNTVRMEAIGSEITVYFNGEKVLAYRDAMDQYPEAGTVGFFTYNRSFEVDYVKIGDPSLKPIQFNLDYPEPTWTSAVGEPALDIAVTSIQSDGITTDAFTVESSDTSIVSISVTEGIATLTPLSKGSATITFTNGSDKTIVRTIEASIAEQFIMPTTSYGDLSSTISPISGAKDEFIDTRLSITLDGKPVLGESGSIRIFNASDDTEVDVIRLNGETDNLGFLGQARVRSLFTKPVSLSGNTLTITPHTNHLKYNTEYYVAISHDVISGAELNGKTFNGLGKNSNWRFTTKVAAPTGAEVTVDDNGPADFRSVQGALNHIMKTIGKNDPAVVNIKNGSYREMLFLRDKNNLSIIGESQNGTVIHYNNAEAINGGSGKSAAPNALAGGRSLFLVEGVDMLSLESLTLKNTRMRSEQGSDQAEVIYFNSQHRLIAKQASFISEQDTLQLKGYSWFYDSVIAGNVDFIWGYSKVALFENSEIRSLGDSSGSDKSGYILQARAINEDDTGFVFLNSILTHAAGPAGNDVPDGSVYLARSDGKGKYYDNAAFINCRMDSHIADVGWFPKAPATPALSTAASGWREYGSVSRNGIALNLSSRKGGYTLTDDEANAFITRKSLFSGYNGGLGWSPSPLDSMAKTSSSSTSPVLNTSSSSYPMFSSASSSSKSSSSSVGSAFSSSPLPKSSSSVTQNNSNTLTIQELEPGFCSAADSDVLIDTKHTGYVAAGFADTANLIGSDIEWRINVPSSGTYPVAIRFANGGVNARSGTLSVNGYQTPVTFELPFSGAWTTWETETKDIDLDAGDNILVLKATSSAGLSNIDSISISGSNITALECIALGIGEVSVSTPEELTSALENAIAGDIINVRAGTYAMANTVSIRQSGTEENPIQLRVHPEDNGRPLLDFSAQVEDSANRGINLYGNYWHVYGLDITKAGDNGMNIRGSNNIIEFSTFFENSDTGLQLDKGAANNLILNCDSFYNADSTLENADGFAAKLDVGTGNRFVGCRAYNNLDDGWDGYLRGVDNITTTFENSWAFNNGYLKNGDQGLGDGNGFKTGGGDLLDGDTEKHLKHNAIFKNCIAAGNLVDGFDHNSNRGSVTILNSVAHKNGQNINFSDTNIAESLTIKNSISLAGSSSYKATITDITNNSWSEGQIFSADDFVSLDIELLKAPRAKDGSLPDTDYMRLKPESPLIDAGVDVGLPYNGPAPDIGVFETNNDL